MRYMVLILGLWLFAAAPSSPAAVPMVKTQAPGFYRMMLGDFEVTALNDGVVAYPTTQVLPHATPEQIASGLFESGITDPVDMSYNGFLINTGSKLVLIDTGTGLSGDRLHSRRTGTLFLGAGQLHDSSLGSRRQRLRRAMLGRGRYIETDDSCYRGI
jgi:hypothetical protein